MSVGWVLLIFPPVPALSRENVFGRLWVALTAKQRKFAWLVASGVSKTKAYAKAYNSRGNARTQSKNGYLICRLPGVAAAIVEFEAQLLPLADMRAEKINMLQNLRNLALSPNMADKIRLAASIKLYEI